MKKYPRGGRELLGAFHRFQPRDTIEWFGSRGVATKTEEDGRMFPTTDDSATIVDCLMSAASRAGVTIRPSTAVRKGPFGHALRQFFAVGTAARHLHQHGLWCCGVFAKAQVQSHQAQRLARQPLPRVALMYGHDAVVEIRLVQIGL